MPQIKSLAWLPNAAFILSTVAPMMFWMLPRQPEWTLATACRTGSTISTAWQSAT